MALENIVKMILSKLFGGKSTSASEMIKGVINDAVTPDQHRQPAAPQQPYYDDVERDIDEGGYVWQKRLWRRHVMAQMFHMLHGKCGLPLSEANYDRCLQRRGVGYSWRMVKDEMYAQSLLWQDDREQFAERNRWFNKSVLEDMARNLTSVDRDGLLRRLASAASPEELCAALRNVDWEKARKSEAWKNAYKGAGAYFTLKNLILFHDCKVHLGIGQVLDRDASFKYVADLNMNPLTTANEMFALMMKVIGDNDFDWRR